MFYLNPEDWSPRFDESFYTVQLTSHEVYGDAPHSLENEAAEKSDGDNSGGDKSGGGGGGGPTAVDLLVVRGKSNHPATYYKLEVQCGHKRRIIYRRYSQFRWLYNNVTSNPIPPSSDSHELAAELKRGQVCMPPKTMNLVPCMPCLSAGSNDYRDEEFLEKRQEELSSFVRDLLTRRGYASHPAVVAFLELDGLVKAG